MSKGRLALDGAYSVAGDDFPDPDDTLYLSIFDDPGLSDVPCSPPLAVMDILTPYVGERMQGLVRLGETAMMKWLESRADAEQVQAKDGKGSCSRSHTLPKKGKGGPYRALLITMWPLRWLGEAIHFCLTNKNRAVGGLVVLLLCVLLRRRVVMA